MMTDLPLTLDEESYFRTYGVSQLDARQVRLLVPRLLATLDRARSEPTLDEGLPSAWAKAEAALPDGWVVYGVTRPGDATRYWASAHGPVVKGRCDMGREHEEYPRENGYGPTPEAALLDLAAALAAQERETTT